MLTIGEVAKEVGINIGAIRFYERKGLLKPAARSEQNNRLYTDDDLSWLVFIKCLRETGMSVEDIKKYYDKVNEGTSTLPERIKLIEDQKKKLLKDIEEKEAQLVHLEEKLKRYYRGENY
ncbi:MULTISPECIES: MerR family transcriptional regulator [unclassified Paenibacillus]|uniref:MerR family transcriptional regulator n=1 Tax=unclassified Paenibacillus TaxID=185978 RepID=UPI00070BC698|nr:MULTISPECIES: MerR family transcriptional regulator [unclassified Paenibacillus]KQX55279.1 MerR family transcriptional regulator [Paenibacillus sp. Root444D2]KRE41206.1 MerR family transcriptional regulator [Paenibacillus sp. Soil724D2]